MLSLELITTYSDMKEAETRLSILEQDFKTLYIIEKASAVIKKAKPVRWLVVSITTAGTVFLYLLWLIVSDQYKTSIRKEFL